MKKIFRNIIIAFLIIVLGVLGTLFYLKESKERKIDQMIEAMPTQDKITQMIIPTFRYYRDENSDRNYIQEIDDNITAQLKRYAFGGVILFGANCIENEKVVRFIDDLQAANAREGRAQLLIAIDQEGGSVTRLEQGTMTSGNMALGAADDLKLTEESASLIAEELKVLGINTDFAPVADINNEPNNPIIGIRSFSDDPDTVAEHVVAFMKGLKKQGIISCLKHFPGHGNTDTDSHSGLPKIDKSYEELLECELIPFKEGIRKGADMIMTAHIQFPQIETEKFISHTTKEEIYLPSTLSKTILSDILRGDLGYEGVIVSDSMKMKAITTHFTLNEAAEMAIEAGIDIMLIPIDGNIPEEDHELEDVIAYLCKEVENGKISEDRLNESVKRIFKLKQKYGLLDTYERRDMDEAISEVNATVGSPDHHDREFETAKKTITLVKNDGVLPLPGEGNNDVIIVPTREMVRSCKYALRLLRKDGKISVLNDVSVYTPEDLKDPEAIISEADHLIFISVMYDGTDIDPYSVWGEYSGNLDKLISIAWRQDIPTVMVSAGLPYDAARYQRADAIVLSYQTSGMYEFPDDKDHGISEYGPNPIAAVYMLYAGDEYTGKVPVDIPYLNGWYQNTDKILYPNGHHLTIN